MEANENLKLVGDQSDIPEDYELVDIEDITKLSESDYGELRSLVRKAIKDGTIRLTRNIDADKNEDKEDAVKFVSEGDARDHRKSRMGSYIKTSQIIRECPVFEQAEKQEGEKQHYLFVGRDGCWRVGPDVTSYSGSVLKHPNKNVEKPPKTGWIYYLDNKWNKDDSLQLIKKQDVPQAKAPIQKKISNICDCTIVDDYFYCETATPRQVYHENVTCLGIAIIKDEIAAVETSLKKGCDINYGKITAKYGSYWYCNNEHSCREISPLILACQWSSFPIISLLVKHPGIDIDKRTNDGETALSIAARKPENLEMIKLLVESGAKVNSRDREGYNPLHRAIKAGDVEMVKYLHSKGANPYLRGTGIDLLRNAVDEENLPMVRYLVQNGASLQLQSPVKYMIEHGADVNKIIDVDKIIDIAHYAWDQREHSYEEKKPTYEEYEEVIRMLETAEANSKHDGVTKTCDCSIVKEFQVSEELKFLNLSCLGIAILQNDIKAVENSLGKGCNINFDKTNCCGNLVENFDIFHVVQSPKSNEFNEGLTPVMLASDLEMVKILVEAGADPDKKTRDGLSLLHLAAYAGQLDILKYLQSKGVYMNTKCNGLGTPLWLAAYRGNLEMVQYLANQGADLDINKYTENVDKVQRRDMLQHKEYSDMVNSLSINRSDMDITKYTKNYSNFPLNAAVEKGHVDVIKFLIKQGADVDKERERGNGIRYSNLELAQAKLDFPGTADKDKPIYEEIICILKEGGAKEPEGGVIKNLVLETLDAIMSISAEKIGIVSAPSIPVRSTHFVPESFSQLPYCIRKLKELSNSVSGSLGPSETHEVWLTMLQALMEDVSVQNPIGPIAMALLMNHTTPYPTPHIYSSIKEIPEMLKILEIASSYEASDIRHINVSIILSFFAQYIQRKYSESVARIKMAEIIMTPATLDYLFGNLKPGSKPEASIFSLLALEFLTNEKENGENQNAEIVRKRFREYGPDDHPLLRIEKLVVSDDFVEKQAGFCAQWYLNNLWPIDNPNARSQQIIDNTNAHWIDNVKLIPLYKSKYLKVGSNGLKVRGDGPWFETVMSTVQVDKGVWYYEVTIITGGFMQIGWGTKKSEFLQKSGYGVGDDEFSQSYDGCRQVVLYDRLEPRSDRFDDYNQLKKRGPISSWKPGDVIGALIDTDYKKLMFSLNGVNIRSNPYKDDVFENIRDGYFGSKLKYGVFAAISLMSFQQCQVNFGQDPFKYPPEEKRWKPLNEAGPKALEGLLVRCHEKESTTKKGPGSWEPVYVVLIGSNLFFYKDPKSYRMAPGHNLDEEGLVELEGAKAEVSTTHLPLTKEHVFRLELANGGQYLFQAHDNDEMEHWVNSINMVANYDGETSSFLQEVGKTIPTKPTGFFPPNFR